MDIRQSSASSWRGLLDNDRGTAAIEYAMIAAGIGVAIVAAVNTLGLSVASLYDAIVTAMGG